MTIRSIIFDGREVRNTLAGNKTRFTRVVKPQPPNVGQCGITFEIDKNNLWHIWCIPQGRTWSAEAAGWTPCHCPFGVPGGLLTVKERLYRSECGVVAYKADHVPVVVNGEPETWRWQYKSLSPAGMPPRASRFTLRVTGVRVKRVQEASPVDCCDEGILIDCVSCNAKPTPARRNPYTHEPELCQVAYPWEDVREETTINRKSSKWHGCTVYVCGNPFVWVTEFEVPK